MGITRVEKRVTKTNRRGEVVEDRTTVRETSTLGKVVKAGLIAGIALLVIGALSQEK